MAVRPPPPGLSWAFPDVPDHGVPRPVAPGVYWLRLPLPFDLDHINVWLLEDGDGWTLVDTGAAAPLTWSCWERLLAPGGLDRPLRRILLTHYHPDHLGLARRLVARTGAVVHATDITWHQCRDLLYPALNPTAPVIRDFCARHEADHGPELGAFSTGALYRDVVDGLPDRHEALQDGAVLTIGGRAWRVVVVGGHAEGHAALHCGELNLLIVGDQVLPTITSNVSKFLDDLGAPDPLGNYLASFARFTDLPADVLVLPSHGRVFRGLHARMDQLRAHHERMLAQVVALCARPRSTGRLVTDLFPQASGGLNYMLAFGEARAHVVYLRERGALAEELVDGRALYAPA